MGYNRRYFYEYITDYLASLIPATEINGIYDSISGLLTPAMKENFISTFSALGHNNYNMVAASEEIHVHKNTLIFRLNKYRELYNMNPIQNSRDRAFFDYFCTYLKRVRKGQGFTGKANR